MRNEMFKLKNDLSSAFRNSFAAKEKGMNGVWAPPSVQPIIWSNTKSIPFGLVIKMFTIKTINVHSLKSQISKFLILIEILLFLIFNFVIGRRCHPYIIFPTQNGPSHLPDHFVKMSEFRMIFISTTWSIFDVSTWLTHSGT